MKWNSTNNYNIDTTNDTFIFSLTLGEKYVQTSFQHSIYCNQSYGPTFGGGHDINIADGGGGYCNFPYSYNLNGKYTSQQQTWTQFSGATNSYNVRYTEYEVFEVDFTD